MRLMLSIPKDHEVVGPDGLLQSKCFRAGPIAIIVGSVISHECDGYIILSHSVPPVRVEAAPGGWTTFANSEAMMEADFVPKFAEAMRMAHEHANAVKEWISFETRKEIRRVYQHDNL